MKIIAISDLHGFLPKNIKKCDVVCIAGDIFPLDIQTDTVKSISWFCLDFKPWAESLPCDKVLFIAGNHDFIFQRLGLAHPEDWGEHVNANWVMMKLLRDHMFDTKLEYLCDSSYTYKGKTFYGTSWCPVLKNWAFYGDDEYLKKMFDKIPIKLDVLITHCPPQIGDVGKVLDKDNWNYQKDFGCKQLADAISNKNIKWVLSGHIHSGDHNITRYQDRMNIVNVSIKDENYRVNYKPFTFEI